MDSTTKENLLEIVKFAFSRQVWYKNTHLAKGVATIFRDINMQESISIFIDYQTILEMLISAIYNCDLQGSASLLSGADARRSWDPRGPESGGIWSTDGSQSLHRPAYFVLQSLPVAQHGVWHNAQGACCRCIYFVIFASHCWKSDVFRIQKSV